MRTAIFTRLATLGTNGIKVKSTSRAVIRLIIAACSQRTSKWRFFFEYKIFCSPPFRLDGVCFFVYSIGVFCETHISQCVLSPIRIGIFSRKCPIDSQSEQSYVYSTIAHKKVIFPSAIHFGQKIWCFLNIPETILKAPLERLFLCIF